MRSIIHSITLIFFLVSFNNLDSQSSNDIELHNRYWTYRENFRKYFISIGKENGQNIAFVEICRSISADHIN